MIAVVAMLALAVPAAFASSTVSVLGKSAVYITKQPNCKAQFYTSGAYKNQGMESCPAGRSERLQWSATGNWAHAVIWFHGLSKCVTSVKVFTDNGVTKAQWRIGNTMVGCTVRVQKVVFSH